MEVTAKMVKELREKTGYGFKLCRDALRESGGDIDKAAEILRKQGMGKAEEMASRPTNNGTIGSYIHFNNLIAVTVEVATQSDSLAQTEELREFAQAVAMQIAFSDPDYISREDIPEEVIENERRIQSEMIADSKKPENIVAKIIDGRLEKYFEEHCLVDQKYIKDDSKTIGQWMKEIIAKSRENIRILRFNRMEVGKG